MSRKIKNIWNCVNTVLIAGVLLLAAALIGVRLFGIEPYVVLSGSMEPVYRTGSLIYVKKADIDDLGPGDVITFHMNGGTVATHRIIEVAQENGEPAFCTKGDANDVADGTAVTAGQVIGTPFFTIPYLGYLAAFLQSRSGRYAAIVAGALLLFVVCLPDLIWGSDRKPKEKQS